MRYFVELAKDFPLTFQKEIAAVLTRRFVGLNKYSLDLPETYLVRSRKYLLSY